MHNLLFLIEIFLFLFNFNESYFCVENFDKSQNLIDRIIFIHTRKCGGWTIHNYFSSKLKSQIGNSCNNISMKESNDWRCDMKYIQDTKEEEQCKAFKKFYNSRFKLF